VLEPLLTYNSSYLFNKKLCDCLANKIALNTLTIKVGYNSYILWFQESYNYDKYIIHTVIQALIKGKIKKVQLVYLIWYNHRLNIEKLIHIKTIWDSGIDLWLWCELKHS
jgi:hypothetical protein